MSRTKYTFSRKPKYTRWENIGYWFGWAVLIGIVLLCGYSVVKIIESI